MKILIFRNFRTKHGKVWTNGEAKEFMAPLLGTREGWEICTLNHENILFFCAALCYGKYFAVCLREMPVSLKAIWKDLNFRVSVKHLLT